MLKVNYSTAPAATASAATADAKDPIALLLSVTSESAPAVVASADASLSVAEVVPEPLRAVDSVPPAESAGVELAAVASAVALDTAVAFPAPAAHTSGSKAGTCIQTCVTASSEIYNPELDTYPLLSKNLDKCIALSHTNADTASVAFSRAQQCQEFVCSSLPSNGRVNE